MAHFVLSAPSLAICPPGDRAEFAFIGRSNVGKSSLINMLLGKKLAQTSGTPGKTRMINYYDYEGAYWVDLPGYGYAKTSRDNRRGFAEMIAEYLEGRKTLLRTMVLIDIRHNPQKADLEFIEYLDERALPYAIIFTKADKLAKTKVQPAVDAYLNELMQHLRGLPHAIATSAETKLGRDAVLEYLEGLTTYSE